MNKVKFTIYIWISICICFVQGMYAQDTVKHIPHQLQLNLGGSINKTGDGVSYLLQHGLGYQYRHQYDVLNARFKHVFGQSLNTLTNRDYTFGMDYNRFWTPGKIWYTWVLGNYTSSYSLNVLSQWQLGIGLAWNAVDRDDLWLNISDGIIYETGRIVNTELLEENRQTLRNSLRINFGWVWKEKLEFKTVNYWQPSLHQISDYLVNSQTDLKYRFYKGFQLALSLSYNKASMTDKENLVFTYGISWSEKF